MLTPPDLFEAIDPDANYFSHFQNSIQSNFVSVDEFIEIFNDNSIMFNLLNYNVRSFYKNSQFILPIIEKSNPEAVVFYQKRGLLMIIKHLFQISLLITQLDQIASMVEFQFLLVVGIFRVRFQNLVMPTAKLKFVLLK